MIIIKAILLRLIYFTGAWKLLRRRNRHRLIILMYHGVTDLDIPVWTQVRLSDFARQMEYVAREYRSTSLEEAIKALKSKGETSDRHVVITFDDGFRNNLQHAYPVLRRLGIPATIFLTTSLIDSVRFKGMLWTDYVTALLLNSKVNTLDANSLGLGSLDLNNNDQRMATRAIVCQHLKKLKADEKNRAINNLEQQLGPVDMESTCEALAGLSWDEVALLDKEDLVSFGAHTVNHEILTCLPMDVMKQEIIDSKHVIEQHSSKPVTAFAYPNGTRDDFDEHTKAVAASEFGCALTTLEGLNEIGTDLYELKRVAIGRNMKLWEFKLSLAGFSEIIDKIKNFLQS
ncbi:MAG: polysaccharide deacetylase family protein [candidate division Zixibacteria bacterium]|nr:polysaccharide deacetylase family protein [candidate division Zixibacteria bacterium]